MEVELFNVPWSLPSIHPVFLSRNSRYFSVKSKHSIEYSVFYYCVLEVIKLSKWFDNKQVKLIVPVLDHQQW